MSSTPAAERVPPATAALLSSAPATAVSVETLTAHLTALPDAQVAAFLSARTDLLSPPSTSFTMLASRAGARPSVEAALADLDAAALAVAEAVVATGSQDPALLGPALLLPDDDVAAHLRRLHRLALVLDAGPVPGLVEAFGAHPLGLAPASSAEEEPAADADLPASLDALHAAARGGRAPEGADEDVPVLPPAALALLDALTWGPPVGTLRDGGQAPGAAPLIEHGWLRRTREPSGPTRLVLPRRAALALRGGRLLREAPTGPDPAQLALQDPASVADQASRAAEESVRLVVGLLEEWGREGGAILRTGGVGVRVLSRTADALGLEAPAAARVVELAAGAGLLGLDEGGAAWVPSREAVHWRAAALPERWAPLAVSWAASCRTPWLVGTRGDDGALRPVLGDGVEASWAGALRRRILLLLEALPEGAVVDPAWVRAALTSARPRRSVPAGAVTGVLAEAEALGVTGGGALSRTGRLLAGALREQTLPAPDGEAPAALLTALEQTLGEDLATPVDVLLLQSDLTAIVPGRPDPDLGALLERASVVESRASALTVRFTAESVRTALDAGWSADELRDALGRWSPAPLPTSLNVLIDDVARHHGAVRVREVASLLRVPDPAVVAGLLTDTRLAGLGLDEVAPGVLVAAAAAGRVLRELRGAGLSPVLEDASGHLLLAGDALGGTRALPAVEPARPGGATHVTRRRRPSTRDLAVLVGRLRAGEQAQREAGLPAGVASDPVHALAVLRQAQASRSRLRLRLAGADGSLQERQVRVLAVEAGRVRLADQERETELTVAVHRIASVEQA